MPFTISPRMIVYGVGSFIARKKNHSNGVAFSISGFSFQTLIHKIHGCFLRHLAEPLPGEMVLVGQLPHLAGDRFGTLFRTGEDHSPPELISPGEPASAVVFLRLASEMRPAAAGTGPVPTLYPDCSLRNKPDFGPMVDTARS